jgi:large subunit ribosomal protein L19
MAENMTLPAVIDPSQVQTGMAVRVHQKIKDVTPSGEEKERIQVFEGLVTTVHGKGTSKTMTVRKVSNGIGVEKIFPLCLPAIVKLEVTKMLRVRRKNIGFVRDHKKRMRDVAHVKVHAKTTA